MGEAFLCSITSLVFATIVFFGCNLQGSFLIFIAVYFLTAMIGIVLAYAVAAAVPTMEAANALLPTYVTFCMYFGGLFLIFDKIPQGWQWYSYTDSALRVDSTHDQPVPSQGWRRRGQSDSGQSVFRGAGRIEF